MMTASIIQKRTAEITLRTKNWDKESPGPNKESGCAALPSGEAATVVLWANPLPPEKYNQLLNLHNTEGMILLPGALSKR